MGALMPTVRTWQKDPKRSYWNELAADASVRLAKGDPALAAANLRKFAANALDQAANDLRSDEPEIWAARARMAVADHLLEAAADVDAEWVLACQGCRGPGPLNRSTLQCRTCERKSRMNGVKTVIVGVVVVLLYVILIQWLAP